MTGLRFFAALAVVLAHSSFIILQLKPSSVVTGWMEKRTLGMTLFFVLSGFVIHYNYRYLVTTQGGAGFCAFLWARFARLYPLFLLMLGFDILFGNPLYDFVAGDAAAIAIILRALPYYLLFMQSWFYVPFNNRSLVDVLGGNISLSWSISTEWFFYLAYPLIAWLVLRARRPVIILAVMLVWSLVWGGMASALNAGTLLVDAWAVGHYGAAAGMTAGAPESFIHWLEYYSPYVRIGEFILGCLTAQLYLQLGDQAVTAREQAIGMLLLAIGVGSVPIFIFFSWSPAYRLPLLSSLRDNYALAPSVALMLFSAARHENAISRFLRGRFLVALGEASYSIYLLHLMILASISGYVTQALPATAPYVVYLVVRLVFAVSLICLISLGLHAIVEAPARRWLRGMWSAGNAPRPIMAMSAALMPAIAALLCVVAQTYHFAEQNAVVAGIRVVSATYGTNCGATHGNATRALMYTCNSSKRCNYVVDVAKLGDPAGGCAKDFQVEYACMPGDVPQQVTIPGEAGLGSHAVLSCAAGATPPQ